ncbi:MAG: GntR family transcriptional regulator [Actinomycetota bacterium]
MPSSSAGVAERTLVADLRSLCDRAVSENLRIPSEPELASQFGVSRSKLREALARLEHEGAITRKPRVGIQPNVDLPPAGSRFDLQTDYLATLASAGYEARVRLVSADIAPAPTELAARLDVEVGSPLLNTRKVWFADDTPAMTAVDRIPVDADLSVADVDLTMSVFRLVEVLCGDTVNWEVTQPSAAGATERVASLLDVEVGAPCMTLRTLGVSDRGQRLFDSLEHHVPDVVEFGLVRTVVDASPHPSPDPNPTHTSNRGG